jgi:cation transport ATPase
MGVTIICGVLAAVNSLVHSTSTLIKQITSANRNFRKTNHSTIEHRVTILLISGSSAVLMAMGIAGESILETWIRSSLFLWLLYYIFISISAYMAWRHAVPLSRKSRPKFTILAKIVSVVGTAAAAMGLFLLEPEPSNMLIFLATVITVVTMVVMGVDFFFRSS